MKIFVATYEINGLIISEAFFEAKNKKEANKLAQFHKRHTPEIISAGWRVKTSVSLYTIL